MKKPTCSTRSLGPGEVALDDLRMVDRAADGMVLGIEFVRASAGIDLRDIPFASTVTRAIGDSGRPIPIYA